MKSILVILALFVFGQATIKVNRFTEPVSADADDPAIWIHPTNPSQSLIFGTDKIKEKGGIYAYNLKGRTVQRIELLDRPNNCDVEYGLGSMDILVVTERLKHRLRVFSIDQTSGKLKDVSGLTDVFVKDPLELREPMGVGLFKSPVDGRVFAVVSRSKGPSSGYLGYYELVINPVNQKIDAKLIRTFGAFSGKKEIESVFVDDELGFVYYSDETFCTRKYALTDLNTELPGPDTKDFKGDHEGITLYRTGKGTGWIICTEQIAGNSKYFLFDRVTHERLGSFTATVDDTDGIEVLSTNLGPEFPNGIFVAMNSGAKNFALIDFRNILRSKKLKN